MASAILGTDQPPLNCPVACNLGLAIRLIACGPHRRRGTSDVTQHMAKSDFDPDRLLSDYAFCVNRLRAVC